MIDRNHKLPVTQQAKLLKVSRRAVYYLPKPARADIADYFNWYNTEWPHSSLDRITPEQTYLNLQPKLALAA